LTGPKPPAGRAVAAEQSGKRQARRQERSIALPDPNRATPAAKALPRQGTGSDLLCS